MTHQGKQGDPGDEIVIVLIGGQLGQIPLIPVIVIVVDPVANGALSVRKRVPAGDFMGKLILHVAEEALLGGVVPAVASAGHRLPQRTVFQKLDELHAV